MRGGAPADEGDPYKIHIATFWGGDEGPIDNSGLDPSQIAILINDLRIDSFLNDDWGLALTPADVNAVNFGCAVGFYNDSYFGQVNVDSVAMEVSYLIPEEIETDVQFRASVSGPFAAVNFRASVSHDNQRDVPFNASVGFGLGIDTPCGWLSHHHDVRDVCRLVADRLGPGRLPGPGLRGRDWDGADLRQRLPPWEPAELHPPRGRPPLARDEPLRPGRHHELRRGHRGL